MRTILAKLKRNSVHITSQNKFLYKNDRMVLEKNIQSVLIIAFSGYLSKFFIIFAKLFHCY